MFALYLSLAALGLAAVDPTGIAAMPVLLLQNHPYRRCCIFLAGSFVSLMAAGLLFARGFGAAVLRFEQAHRWLVPAAEVLAAVVLLAVGLGLLWQLRAGKLSAEPSAKIMQRLELSDGSLFTFGAVLVAIQSVVDVVFAVAMIRIGQLHLTALALTTAVATYAVAALVFQIAVVVAYWLTPVARRDRALSVVHRLLTSYANQTVIVVSLVLGLALLALAATSLE